MTQVYEESGGHTAPVLADRYRLIAQLGRGGTARVVRAWDERLGRAVAIKIFQPHADPVGRLRFEDEAKLLAGFDHPGLVKVFDSGVAHGEPFLVLELIDGPHLGRKVDDGPMSVDAVRSLGISLAEALAYVHSRGVVHRDIKPGNVLLDSSGTPKLADFGLAKLLDRSGLTASDRLVGTAAYLSPEQVLGTTVGPPADIYGLGLVLLECLTGEVEYPGLDAETVLARISRRPRIPVGVPASLAETLEAMTRSEPSERPTATEIVDLLSADVPTVPIARPKRFNRTAAAVILGLGVMGGAIGLLVAAPAANTAPPPASIAPQQGHAVDSTLTGGVVPGAATPSNSGSGRVEREGQQKEVANGKPGETVTVTPATPPAVSGNPGDPTGSTDPVDPVDPANTKTKTKTKTKTPKNPPSSGQAEGEQSG
ncbi:serine/threonine-protein kinase [Actinocrispum sp. NPDC049592]|uniref:serine/threonine-protein kinase n=1 Tax=Actinocrispum sp. NPDC049592 TaxID=3154835 RepID=UPI00343CBD59